MDEQLREIEGLLKETKKTETETSKFKKYAKIVLPHVALVAFVCLYAVVGAWIFYSLESPHEDRLKKKGVMEMNELRQKLIYTMWEKRKTGQQGMSLQQWTDITISQLQNFNENLYKAFKEQYVRYSDVKITQGTEITSTTICPGDKNIWHRKPKKRSERGDKLWTASSAIFFAATTMATIGYGNIVPVTSYGRITCVVFALFGAPLAIITIGDLGKFLSECTIWLYNKIRKLHEYCINHCRRYCNLRDKVLTEAEVENDSISAHARKDWSKIVNDRTEVPVLLVFAILLLYIAFGGILFAILESWTYMEAFYYCFVSLTTIGFGDIVPERHEYLLLMLIYLGVGLAVTTMCIDLAGIQYIQKIHYFGRKFRGTDLLQILRKKRMIERRLAMGNCDDLLEIYLQTLQDSRLSFGEPQVIVNNNCVFKPSANLSTAEGWRTANLIVGEEVECNMCRVEEMHTPTLISLRSYNSKSESSSIIWKHNLRKSIESLLSTTPSVAEREDIYANFRNVSPSLMSFYYKTKEPSIDLCKIAEEVKKQRRISSCPGKLCWLPQRLVSVTNSPIGLACMERWDTYLQMLDESRKPYKKKSEGIRPAEVFITINDIIPVNEIEENFEEGQDESKASRSFSASSSGSDRSTPFSIDLGAFEIIEADIDADILLSRGEPVLFLEEIPVHSVHHNTVQTEAAIRNLVSASNSILTTTVPPAMVEDNYCFIIDGDKIKMSDIVGDQQWWRHTSRPTKYFYLDNMRVFHRVNCITSKDKIISAKLPMRSMNSFDIRSPSNLSISAMSPKESILSPSSSTSSLQKNEHIQLSQVYKIIRYYSFWKTCTSFHRIVTVMEKVNDEQSAINLGFKKRVFVQYIWRNAKASEKARVKLEFDLVQQQILKTIPTNALNI